MTINKGFINNLIVILYYKYKLARTATNIIQQVTKRFFSVQS